jgi:hypothetical protein
MRLDEFGGRQHVQVEGQRGSGKMQMAGNLAGRETLGREAHEQAENVQARFLGQGGEGIDSL